MADDPKNFSKREMRLAYAGAAGFVVLTLAAAAHWARAGEIIYATRILSQLANCF